MRLGVLLFAAFVLIVGVSFAYPVAVASRQLRLAYLESAEEPLVDTANLLASLVGAELERGGLDVDRLYAISADVRARRVDARIYQTLKERVDLDVYLTDVRGRVIFDSRGRATVGEDYSEWRDVRRTLAGEYGARVGNPAQPLVLYVAAPVRVRGRIVGSLTVIKPTAGVVRLLARSRPRLIALFVSASLVALVSMLAVSVFVHRQTRRLTEYADAVRLGRRLPFPDLAQTELRRVGLAFERMRASLAGHEYIEAYVRALTHEIKSPLSAIRGAAEILEDRALDDAHRERFLRNLRVEAARIEDLVDRMLELSELEARRALPRTEPVDLARLVRRVVDATGSTATARSVRVAVEVAGTPSVVGDPFLLELALSNLLKNALDWSPDGGAVRVGARSDGDEAVLTVEDEGPGIPAFARARVFERFYSLERPGERRKGTGLGLTFVREIAELHGGSITLEHREPNGLRAELRLRTPVAD